MAEKRLKSASRITIAVRLRIFAEPMLSPQVKNPGIMQRHRKKGKKRRTGAKFLRAMFYFPTAGGGRVKARIHRRPAKIYRSKYRALDSVEVYKGPCPVTTNFYSHPRAALERVRKSWGRPGYLRVIVNCTRLLVYPGIQPRYLWLPRDTDRFHLRLLFPAVAIEQSSLCSLLQLNYTLQFDCIAKYPRGAYRGVKLSAKYYRYLEFCVEKSIDSHFSLNKKEIFILLLYKPIILFYIQGFQKSYGVKFYRASPETF